MKNSDLKQYIKEKIITTLSEDMNNPRMILSDFYVKVGGRNFAAAITDIEDDNLLDNIVKALNFREKDNIKSIPLNLGNDIGYSIKEVIQVAEKITGKSLNYKVSKRREGDPPELIASSTKARELLKWTPQSSDLETIIKDAWAWEKKLNSIRLLAQKCLKI